MARTTKGLSPGARRILVVDDDVDGAAMMAALLELSGHEVRLAHDGAFAIASARAFRPDFVFLDLGLPALDGFEVARTLRREPGLESMRIIALTGSADAEARERALEAGCDQYLVKPIDPGFLDSLLGGTRG
jgi:CheY-like chemotaxis protein